MALTATILQVCDGVGPYRLSIIKVAGDNSYVTGGYTVTPAMFGFSTFAPDGLGSGIPPTLGNYALMADMEGTKFAGVNSANGKLQLYVTTTGVEVGNGVTAVSWSGLLEAYGT